MVFNLKETGAWLSVSKQDIRDLGPIATAYKGFFFVWLVALSAYLITVRPPDSLVDNSNECYTHECRMERAALVHETASKQPGYVAPKEFTWLQK